MIIKKGVNLKGLKPEILLALIIADGLHKDMIVTSAVRDKGPKSLHPYGYAADEVYHGCDHDTHKDIVIELKEKLGNQYDVLYHNAGSGWHIHIEFDPR